MFSKLVIFLLLLSNFSYAQSQEKLDTYISNSIKTIIEKHDYTIDKVFYVDFSIPANQPRFFVINLIYRKVLAKGYCASGKTNDSGVVIFSNLEGSNCSSKGAYKIGKSYIGKYGKSYILYGLDSTNSNAYDRNIVIHPYSNLEKKESFRFVPVTEGCVGVTDSFLNQLSSYIDKSVIPILLIIDSN